MAESCTLLATSGTQSDEGDASTYSYLVILDDALVNPHQVAAIARTLGPNPLPQRRQPLGLGTNLFAREFSINRTTEKNLTGWQIDVTFNAPDRGEDDTHQTTNPLTRPPLVNVRNVGRQYVVKQARNVTELTGGFTRPEDTLGPIVNAAFRRPDEPVVDTENTGVLVVRRNFANLGQIITLNEQFKRTTNSDTVKISGIEFGPRTLKYYVTESEGMVVEEGYSYFPATTEIEITDTTDLIIDNVGFEYWDDAASKYKRAVDGDGEPTAEPVNLDIDGTLLAAGEEAPKTITYRYLDEVAYASFFA